jgi:hypothetical protein
MINPDAMNIKKIRNDINVAPISTEKDGVAIVFVCIYAGISTAPST